MSSELEPHTGRPTNAGLALGFAAELGGSEALALTLALALVWTSEE